MTTETAGPGTPSILSTGWSRWLGTAVILVFATLAGSASVGEKIPANFKIVAKLSTPVVGGWGWETTITRDGRAVQIAKDYKSGTKTERISHLDNKQMQQLVKIIKGEKFFNLKKSYSGGETDCPVVVLTITAGMSTHQVTLDGFGIIDQDEEGVPKRFAAIWSEVLKKVPKPERSLD